MKIDFYILEANVVQKALLFTCEVLAKSYAEQKKVYVNMDSLAEAERLEALLWTYSDDSFVPHNLYKEDDNFPPPIQIGANIQPKNAYSTLVNLAKQVPAYYSQFEHIVEIVFADPLIQQQARDRYKQYRDFGCEINTIKLK